MRLNIIHIKFAIKWIKLAVCFHCLLSHINMVSYTMSAYLIWWVTKLNSTGTTARKWLNHELSLSVFFSAQQRQYYILITVKWIEKKSENLLQEIQN